MLNRKILAANEPCLYYNNRGLVFGDAFSFQVRGNSSKSFFLNDNYQYLITTAEKLKMKIPENYKVFCLETDIELLLQKNRIYKEFSARITVFRNDDTNFASILISVEALQNEYYSLNETGLKISTCENYNINQNLLKHNHYFTPVEEVLLKQQIQNSNIDNLLITDENDNIIKTCDSNVFFVKDNHVFVPKEFINDSNKMFSEYILKIVSELNIKFSRIDIKTKDIKDLDEIFIVNPIIGINWVLAHGEKRFFRNISIKIVEKLNKTLR